ncbi:MAG: hypothetical protein ACFBZ9_08660 [Sphingomonadales bacterium]
MSDAQSQDQLAKDQLEDHLQPSSLETQSSDYLTWKASKVKIALAEADDRSKLTPAHEVWDKLGLER